MSQPGAGKEVKEPHPGEGAESGCLLTCSSLPAHLTLGCTHPPLGAWRDGAKSGTICPPADGGGGEQDENSQVTSLAFLLPTTLPSLDSTHTLSSSGSEVACRGFSAVGKRKGRAVMSHHLPVPLSLKQPGGRQVERPPRLGSQILLTLSRWEGNQTLSWGAFDCSGAAEAGTGVVPQRVALAPNHSTWGCSGRPGPRMLREWG